ncbi:MAG: hypothetical protein GY898_13560 [Proteobacteria bacterium]|nr:hypothetical protein [Pseudomonadota bacterium]
MSSRDERVRLTLTVVLLLVAGAAATIGGCIRRYPAPTHPEAAPYPYSAIVTWRRIALPPMPEAAPPLPKEALRLAVGPTGDSVFADTALVERFDELTAEGWEEAIVLLEAHADSLVVLLADPAAMTPATCENLAPLADRLIAAGGAAMYADDSATARPSGEEGSRDPLGAIELSVLCPGGP